MDKWLKYLAYVAALVMALWSQVPDAMRYLLAIMALDIITGSLVAARKGKLSYDVALSGGTKKIGMIIIIALMMIIEDGLNLFPGIHIVSALIGYYIWTEALSVVTNAALLGVPVPDFATNALARLNPEKLAEPVHDPHLMRGA